jgi:hypothetical protein
MVLMYANAGAVPTLDGTPRLTLPLEPPPYSNQTLIKCSTQTFIKSVSVLVCFPLPFVVIVKYALCFPLVALCYHCLLWRYAIIKLYFLTF